MDKLKELLKRLGGSDELVAALSEEFGRYAQGIKEQYEKEFKTKIERARQVCLEEVSKEKAALARKVAIYLESKQESIEKAAEKNRLNEDTEATSLLKRTKALLEGINIDDGGQSRDLQAARKSIERLKAAVGTLKEERDVAVRKANDSNRIALDSLKRNKLLESKLRSAGLVGTPAPSKDVVAESKAPAAATTAPAPAAKPAAPKRLDESRRVPDTINTTRRTLSESQSGGKKTGTPRASDDIGSIAAAMSED